MIAEFISIALLLLLPALVEAQPVARCSGPLSEAQLTELLKGSVPAPVIEQNVAKCGIAFEPDAGAIGRLRSAGMPQTVLDAVRAAVGPPATIAPGTKKVNPKDGLTYVWIPPGTFQMGCSPGDNECFENEKPAHQVTITRGFWLGQTPVTQQAYQRVTGQHPSQWNGVNLPVDTVSWNEARAYCAAIGGRLPTEAEWEYAARAGSTGARYGNLDEIAWYSGNSGGQTHEVGQKLPNAFGLYDMLGNVRQWVMDWDGKYLSGAQSDPFRPGSGAPIIGRRSDTVLRVVRGAAWDGNPKDARVSLRNIYRHTNSRYSNLGLRCAGE